METRPSTSQSQTPQTEPTHYAYIVCGAEEDDDMWMYIDAARVYWFLVNLGFPRANIRTLVARSFDSYLSDSRKALTIGSRGGHTVWDQEKTRFIEDLVDDQGLKEAVVETIGGSGPLSFKTSSDDTVLIFLFGHGRKLSGNLCLGCDEWSPAEFHKTVENACRRAILAGYFGSCYSAKFLNALKEDASHQVFISCAAKQLTYSLFRSASGEMYGGIFAQEVTENVAKSPTNDVPVHLEAVKQGVKQEFAQDVEHKDTANLSATHLNRFFRALEPIADDNQVRPPPQSAPKRRKVATSRIQEVGPREYLRRCDFPFDLHLPEEPWAHPSTRDSVHTNADDVGLARLLIRMKASRHTAEDQRKTNIIDERHAMIIAFAEVATALWYCSGVSKETLAQMFPSSHPPELTEQECESIREHVEVVESFFPEMVVGSGPEYCLYLHFGMSLLVKNGLSIQTLKSVLEQKQLLWSMAAENKGPLRPYPAPGPQQPSESPSPKRS